MSTQYLKSDHPRNDILINNVSIDKFARPAQLHNQTVSPTTHVDVGGDHTVIVQTMPLTTPHDNVTQFRIQNLGNYARTSWVTGDIVKINIVQYSGYDGVPFVTGYKHSDNGDYIVDIANVVRTGSPPDAYPLNGRLQLSVELIEFNVDGIP